MIQMDQFESSPEEENWREYMNLNNWVVRDYYNLVHLVNSFEPHMEKLSNEQVCLFASIILSFFTYLI